MRTLLFVIAGVVLVTPSARAEPPRYSRKPDLKLDVKLSNRVRPTERAATPQRQPALTADAVLLLHDRAQPIRREQEAILVRLIGDTPDDDPEKPDYLFRLAEHYAHQQRFWRLKAIAPTIPTRSQRR